MISRQTNIYGANGHAKVVIDTILSNKDYGIGHIYDDNEAIKSLMGLPVKESKKIENTNSQLFIIAIGNNPIRKKITESYTLNYANYVAHTSAIISPTVSIGKGTVLMAGAIINADARIGKHAIINTGSIIEHDCIIEDFVHISPNAALAGNVRVGEGTHIGIGAQVIQGVNIGKWCIIGAGAVILKDVPDGATVVGNPGRIIK